MVTKKKTPVPSKMSKKMLKRKKPINSTYFLDVSAITENQELFFKEWGCLLYTSPSPRARG